MHKRISWHEGMVILPCMFQQQEEFFQHYIHVIQQAMSPYLFGIIRYEYDEILFAQGVLSIGKIQAIMPDGTYVDFQADRNTTIIKQQPPLQFNFSEYGSVLHERPLKLYLSVLNKANYDRYESYVAYNVKDITEPELTNDVPMLIPKCNILIEKDLSSNYTYLPFIEITVTQDVYKPTTYLPPCLMIEESNYWWKKTKSIALKIRNRLNAAYEKLSSINNATQHPQLSQLVSNLLPGLLQLESLLNLEKQSIWLLYSSIINMIGHLSLLYQGIPIIPKYNHFELGFVFKSLTTTLERAILLLQEDLNRVPFKLNNKDFTLKIQNSWLKDNRFMISVRGDNAATWIEQAFICSIDRLQNLRELRVLGCARSLKVSLPTIVLSKQALLCEVIFDEDFCTYEEEIVLSNHLVENPFEIFFYLPSGSKVNLEDEDFD